MKQFIHYTKLLAPMVGALCLTLAIAAQADQTDATNPVTIERTAQTVAPAAPVAPQMDDTLPRMTPDQMVALEKARHESHFDWVAILVPASFFASVVVIIALLVGIRLKKTKILHETIRSMIEKGQPIPPELLRPQAPPEAPRSDLRRGLVLIGVGLGVAGMAWGSHFFSWTIGLIPLLIGVAFLITWKLESNKNGKS